MTVSNRKHKIKKNQNNLLQFLSFGRKTWNLLNEKEITLLKIFTLPPVAAKTLATPTSNDPTLAMTLVKHVLYKKSHNMPRKCSNTPCRFLSIFVVMTNFCSSYGDLLLHRRVQFLLWLEGSEEYRRQAWYISLTNVRVCDVNRQQYFSESDTCSQKERTYTRCADAYCS
jgi:hypothetical protein